MDALLVAEDLLAGEHERGALTGEDDGLGQACGALTVGLGTAGHRLGQLVGETEVVVARDIVDNLRGGGGVGKLRVVALAVVDLRVSSSGDDANFDGLFVAGLAGSEAAVLGVAVVTFDGVADVIGEDSHLRHCRDVLLEGAVLGGQGRVAGGPAFSVDEDVRVDFLEGGGNLVHGLRVMDGHKVEAEAVDVVFLCPVDNGVDNEIAHLLALGGRLVAAARGVAVAAVGTMAIVVAGSGKAEVGVVILGGVVVYDIHHHAYADVVESLHHLLYLAHPCCRVGGIGGVRALGGIVVVRVVAPVIGVGGELGLVHTVVVVAGEDVHVCHAEVLEMGDARRASGGGTGVLLGEGQKLALVDDAAAGVHRVVAVVHLVEDGVGDVGQTRAAVAGPALGVGGGEVDDGGAVAVGTGGLGPYAGGLGEPFAVVAYVESIELARQIFGDGGAPHAAVGELHIDVLHGRGVAVGVVEVEVHGLGLGAPQGKACHAVGDSDAEVGAVV